MAAPLPEPIDDENIFPAEEGRRMFENSVREQLNMSGEEFIRRWDAGEFKDVEDIPENWHILHLSFLIPLGRQDR